MIILLAEPLNIDYCVTNPQLVSKPWDHWAPTFVQFDSFTGTPYFNDTSAVGGVLPTDIREPHLHHHVLVFSNFYRMKCIVDSKL